MKKLLYLFLLLFIPLVSFGQDYGNSADAIKLCSFLQTNNFGTDAEAERGLDRILSIIGASKRFVLQPCSNINNAVAASYKGIRYIFYDRNFMFSVNSGNNWENLFILAHEVGHHINGHSLDLALYAAEIVEPETLANQRKQELEADEFAGFILAKLGATLEQTSLSVNLIASNRDDFSSTHPSKSKRLAAISIGFNKALVNKTVINETDAVPLSWVDELELATKAIELDPNYANNYILRGDLRFELLELKEAIADYTKAIELDPNYADAYFNRGYAKEKLEDYKGAIADYTIYIELDPSADIFEWKAEPYIWRGGLKEELKDYYGAIADFTKAIELTPNYADSYVGRSDTKRILKDYKGSLEDLMKALELDPSDYYIIKKIADLYANYLKDYKEAIAYYTKAIKCCWIYPSIYTKIGAAKENLEDYKGAIADYTKTIESKPNTVSYYKRGNAKRKLEDYYGAIADFTKVIEIYPNAKTYYNRGNTKFSLEDYKGAIADYTKAIKSWVLTFFQEDVIQEYSELIGQEKGIPHLIPPLSEAELLIREKLIEELSKQL